MFKRAQSVTLNIKIYKTNIVFRDVTNQNMFKHTTVWLSFNPFLEQQDKKNVANKILEFQAFTLISLINVEVGINMEGVQKMQNHQTWRGE